MNTHIEITPFSCWIPTKYFYDLEDMSGFTKCKVFAVSSYKCSVPTFNVRIMKNGGLFHYIPVQALFSEEKPPVISPDLLCYHDCPDYQFTINEFEYLRGKTSAFIGGQIYNGKYVLTADWYRSNLNMHLIALDCGQFCWLPSHKVLFRSNENQLPDYKKLHATFSVNK